MALFIFVCEPNKEGRFIRFPYFRRMLEVLERLLESPYSERPLRIRNFRGETVIFRDPDRIRAVLKDRRFVRADLVKLAFGEGIATSEDKPGSERRKVLTRQFGTQLVSRFFHHSVEVFEETCQRWNAFGLPREMDLAREINRMTLEVVCRSALGRTLGQDFQAVSEAIGWSITAMGSLSGLSVSESPAIAPDFHKQLERVGRVFDDFAIPLIRSARSSSFEEPNILGALAESNLSEREVRDEIVSLLLAGSETSALTLSWTFVAIRDKPEVFESLRREADQVLGDEPRFEQVGELVLARAAVEETLRLYPPVWHMVRRASEDLEVLGEPITAGTDVVVSPYLLHREEEHWDTPCAYSAERFLCRKAEKENAFMPFSSGHHICLGRKAALVEAAVLLALFCRSFEIEMLDREFPARFGSTLRHGKPLRSRLSRRC